MITLKDGPAKGSYACEEGPYYLRAVGVPTLDGALQRLNVLDLDNDRPEDGERVYVYRMVRWLGFSWIHLSRPKRVYNSPTADYEWLPDVDGEQLRERDVWRRWWTAHGPSQAEMEAIRAGKYTGPAARSTADDQRH